MSDLPESVLLVEGFDDRGFWGGLLVEHLGCKISRVNLSRTFHGGTPGYTYDTPTARGLVHVIPYKVRRGGASPLPELAEYVALKLNERSNRPMLRLVLAPDGDIKATVEDARRSIRATLVAACPALAENNDGDFSIDEGKLIVSTLFVHADSARSEDGRLRVGVPEQRALEQLVCTALRNVFPERAEAVGRWLAARPAPTGKEHKAHAWSFYAGWFTEQGTGDFYGSLWRDARVASELKRLLEAQGAWRVIESLLQP